MEVDANFPYHALVKYFQKVKLIGWLSQLTRWGVMTSQSWHLVAETIAKESLEKWFKIHKTFSKGEESHQSLVRWRIWKDRWRIATEWFHSERWLPSFFRFDCGFIEDVKEFKQLVSNEVGSLEESHEIPPILKDHPKIPQNPSKCSQKAMKSP